MDSARYRLLELTGNKLTEEELKEGWHYCADWDYMLIGPDWPELEGCACQLRYKKSGSSSSC